MRFRDAMSLSRRLACAGAAALALASLSCGPPTSSLTAKPPASPAATTHLSLEATLHRPSETPSPEADASAPLELTLWARTEGSSTGPFKNAMRLQQGDRLYFDGQASKQAYVYMLHCDEKQALERIPEHGYIPVSVRQRSAIPEQYQYFEVDSHKGEEVIYVVASERALADGPAFYDALTQRPQQEAVHLDCGRPNVGRGLPSPIASVPRPKVAGKNSPPSPSAALPPAVAPASLETTARPPEQPSLKPPSDPVAKTLRGTPIKGGASVSTTRADQAGIMVMRFSFEH